MEPFAVIVPAAGRSTRFGDATQKKIYREIDGRSVWLRAIEPFLGRDDVIQIIVAIAADDREMFERRYRANVAFLGLTIIDGGAERVDTVAAGLEVVRSEAAYVAIHDAARPCVTPALIDAVFQAARTHGAALPGLPVTDTIKRLDPERRIVETVARQNLVAVQTPQAFRRDLLERAYAERSRLGGVTDDAMLVEGVGGACHVVEGSPENLKITTAIDLKLAAAILADQARRQGPVSRHPFAEESARPELEGGKKRRFEDFF